MLSKISVILTFNSYRKMDLKRKFLFFNQIFSSFIGLKTFTLSVLKSNTLISLLRSPFVHKKSFEQFFFTFYNCKFRFFYVGFYLSVRSLLNTLNIQGLIKFISKSEVITNSSFFF